MFHFLKKSGQKYKPKFIPNYFEKSSNSESSDNVLQGCKVSRTIGNAMYVLDEEEEDEIDENSKTECHSFYSRLSKTLPEILSNKSALGYFIQFMDTRNSMDVIKFWLEVECLCGASSYESIEPTTQDVKSIPTPVDNNDNFNCNITDNSVNEENNLDKGIKSKDYVIPKTSRAQRSNNELSNMSTTCQDALRIHKKYIVKNLLGANCIPETLRFQLEQALESENTEIILKSLSIIQSMIYKVLENEHFHDFLRSEFYCKHQIDVLTSGKVQLADILYNETTFFYFIEFMELENKRELLDFWMAAMNYKQNLLEKSDTSNPMDAQADALIIYEKYFSLQATTPLGFSDKIRFQVEENICRENGEGPLPDCFDKPCKIVYNFLNKHYLPTFLSSQLYYTYLSELIITIQSSSCSGVQPRLKRTGSDCSSEISSVSTLNISQVGNDTNGKKTKLDGGSMNIDTRQLYDPDSLWKRNKYSLSVGYIDDLGRFVTEIEPDPHRKYESRLSRAVKRLVNMDQDKAKEELAWKIAEMIIRDITSLTLGKSNLTF